MKTIIIDTETLNTGADLKKLEAAVAAEFACDVEVKKTGRGTELVGFGDAREETARDLESFVDRLDF